MRRGDCVSFVALVDRPNLQRLREVYSFCLPDVLHIRHVRELYFESAHQPLKRAIISGNGHNEARTPMYRMLEMECFSPIAAEPLRFNVPPHYWQHVGIATQLREAVALRTLPGGPWRVSNRGVMTDAVPALALSLALHHCDTNYSVPWRRGATRGGSD